MRFRLGFVTGFAAGYYLGAMAGRERYEQMNNLLSRLRRSQAVETAADKAKAVVDVGVERAKDVFDERFGADGLNEYSSTERLSGPAGGPTMEAPSGVVSPEVPPPFNSPAP